MYFVLNEVVMYGY